MSDRLAKIVASFFYVGHIPWAPGTFGSAAGFLIFWFLPENARAIATAMICLAAFWACPGAVRAYQSKDPSQFVADEAAGMMVSLLWLPKNIWVYAAAFFIFRFFDIVKPGPIRTIQNGQSASCIVWDDVLAGVFTNAVLRGALFLGGPALAARLVS